MFQAQVGLVCLRSQLKWVGLSCEGAC
uniref:Uncharacterized protein n=1 Tax=Rhizophora mucronata TaxID=61149 RepID=A0A2P2PZS0_RHIMU